MINELYDDFGFKFSEFSFLFGLGQQAVRLGVNV